MDRAEGAVGQGKSALARATEAPSLLEVTRFRGIRVSGDCILLIKNTVSTNGVSYAPNTRRK